MINDRFPHRVKIYTINSDKGSNIRPKEERKLIYTSKCRYYGAVDVKRGTGPSGVIVSDFRLALPRIQGRVTIFTGDELEVVTENGVIQGILVAPPITNNLGTNMFFNSPNVNFYK